MLHSQTNLGSTLRGKVLCLGYEAKFGFLKLRWAKPIWKRRYIHLLNHEKIGIKSEVEDNFLNQSDEASLLTSKFWP